jgi:hypothetical protein
LQLMADAPAHHLFVLLGMDEIILWPHLFNMATLLFYGLTWVPYLLGTVDESENQLPDILCVIQVWILCFDYLPSKFSPDDGYWVVYLLHTNWLLEIFLCERGFMLMSGTHKAEKIFLVIYLIPYVSFVSTWDHVYLSFLAEQSKFLLFPILKVLNRSLCILHIDSGYCLLKITSLCYFVGACSSYTVQWI